MVEMEVRIHDVADVVGLDAQGRELADDAFVRARMDGEQRGHALAEARDRIGERVAMNPGIEEQLALRVDDEVTRHRRDDALARGARREKQVLLEFQRTAGQGVDAQHAGIVGVFRAACNAG